MLRTFMRRLGLGIGISLAVLLSAQLVLHNHSLFHERMAPPCAICAFGADHTIVAPTVSAPLVLAYVVTPALDAPVLASAARTFSSRAPPRA